MTARAWRWLGSALPGRLAGAHRLLPLLLGLLCLLEAPATWRELERANSQHLADEARAKVYVGMPLSEAERALQGDWHHFDCPVTSQSSLYFYFFGSTDLSRTGIVLLGATGPIDRRTVALVTEAANEILYQFDGCSPLDLSVTRTH
jgi:hypothetical protein